MKILGLIPARGGSKGVKRKNIKLLGGRPLISYTIESALSCKQISKVVVSTEDEEIANIARNLGAEVPFMRPESLASDTSPTIETIIHSLDMLEEHNYDAICILQPTYPFRSNSDLNQAVQTFISSEGDSLISMKHVPHQYHPDWIFKKANNGTVSLYNGDPEPRSRRQDLQEVFLRDGAIYLVKTKVIKDTGTIYGKKIIPYVMEQSFDVNIDTEADWLKAEAYLKSKNE